MQDLSTEVQKQRKDAAVGTEVQKQRRHAAVAIKATPAHAGFGHRSAKAA
jgi:hypothetical protein